MSRSSAGAPGVNLMPLLDVLLCTMGTLIVVLGVLNREARYHPAKRLPGKAANAAKAEELKNAKEDLDFIVQQLDTSHEKTLVDLQNSRVRLSGIEDSSRQLEDKFHSLEGAVKDLQSTDAADNAKRDQLRVALLQLNTKRMQLDSDLQKGRANAKGRQPVYAVVPFEGMYKTSRRPIYIECRGDTVILQPEGIAFTAADFLGPAGPGNPLASALRAAQEYWRNAPRNNPNLPNEPYPLLLVRPDGIIAYYLVRDAMTSWDAEFGYELIGVDWKLDFPMQVEPQLKEMETRAVADARERLQWLAQASPELFQRKASKVQYHVSPFRGGSVRDGGPSLGNDPFADDPLGGFGKPGNNSNAGVANNMGSPNGVPGGMNGGSGTGSGNLAGAGGSRFADGRGNAAFGFSGTGSNLPGGTGGGNSLGTGGGGSNLAGGINPGGTNFPAGAAAAGMGNGIGGNSSGSSGGSPGGLVGDSNSAFSGGSTGSSGPNGGGPELSGIGPRYAGTGNDLGDGGQFAPGLNGGGQYGGGQNGGGKFAGGQNAGGQFAGQGSGGTSSGNQGAAGSGNGMSAPPNAKLGNYQGGAAGSLSNSGGMPGGGLTSSEYGGVMLPGAAGGYMSAGSMTSGGGGAGASGSAGASGAGNGMSGTPMNGAGMSGAGMNGTPMAGGATGSPGGGDSSAGGGGSSGSPSSASGSDGGMQSASASGSQNTDPQANGMPSLSFNMTPQQQENLERQQLEQQQQQQQSSSSPRSAKMRRQRNWALPNSSTSSVPIQRPIRVECWNDRLVLLPDTRDLQAEVIPLPPQTSDAVDQLVAAVRTYTKTWGIAGRGMYWKPQLILEVTPNGESRAKDLTEILADSGWDVKRK